jgi:predicted lipoprotein
MKSIRVVLFAALIVLTAGLGGKVGANALKQDSDLEPVVVGHIQPRYARLQAAATDLSAAAATCDVTALRRHYHSAFSAWMAAQHIAFGPVEVDNRRYALAFWPDTRGFVRKALDRLRRGDAAVLRDPAAFRKRSVAGRGLSALELILFHDPDGVTVTERDCAIAQAIAVDIQTTADLLAAAWSENGAFRAVFLSAGTPGNADFPAVFDAAAALFRSLDSSLEGLSELRLGRPLGTFDKPRPRRAEAWRSGRSTVNIRIILAALEDFYRVTFQSAATEADQQRILGAFARCRVSVTRAPAGFEKIATDLQQRVRFESLQSCIRQLQGLLRANLRETLGIGAGFNALDGD